MIVSHDSGVGAVVVGLRMSVGACCGSHQNFTVGAERRCWCLYVTQASNLMRLMFPPSWSCSFDALRSSADGLNSGGTDRLVGPAELPPPPPVPPPPPPAPAVPPPAAPASSRSLPSKELALLLTLSAGERPVGGSRHSREPGYWGGAVRMVPPEVEDGVVDGGGQGVLRSRPGEMGSDLMLTPELVLTVSMAPWGMLVTGLRMRSQRQRKKNGRKTKGRTKRKSKRQFTNN